MKKMKLTVLLTAIMLLLPLTFASANELTIVEAPETGTSSMSGVVGGQEVYYTASSMKARIVVKYNKFKAVQSKKLYFAKMKQHRFTHLPK